MAGGECGGAGVCPLYSTAMTCAAVILAAGGSRRLQQPKQLVRVDGETLLSRAMRAAREAGARPVIVVLGARFDSIAPTVAEDGILVVRNEEWEEGIASSIRTGVRALAAKEIDASGVLLMACDQPHVTAGHLRALLEEFDQHAAEAIVASAYGNTVGVPAVFPVGGYAALMNLKGDQGARKIIADPRCRVVQIELPGGEVDVDLPEDLAKLGELKRSADSD